MQLKAPAHRRCVTGFSLLEVMVTCAIVAIGLLGVAKMTAAAISNTQVARVRSLIALQADSLAAAMHGNPGYWAAGLAPASFSASSTSVTDAGHVLDQTVDCTAGTCTPAQLAADDVQTWARNLDAQFKGYAATVTCTNASGAPVNCTITLTWSEKVVAINRTTAAASAVQQSTQRYALHVQP